MSYPLHLNSNNYVPPRDLANYLNYDLRSIKDEYLFNCTDKVHKEYLKNASEYERKNKISCIRRNLLQREICSRMPKFDNGFDCCKLPKYLNDTLDMITSETKLDRTGLLLLILGATEASLCGKVQVEFSSLHNEPAVLYILGISPSGTRKSHAMKLLFQPHRDFTNNLNNTGQSEIKKQIGRYLKNSLRQKGIDGLKNIFNESGPLINKDIIEKADDFINKHVALETETLRKYEPTLYSTLVVDKVSASRLFKLMNDNGENICIASAEGHMIDSLTKTNDGSLRNIFLCAYDDEAFSSENSRNQYRFVHPTLNTIIFTQPENASKLYKSKNIKGIGLTERMIPYIFGMNQSIFNENRFYKEEKKEPDYELYYKKITNNLAQFYTQKQDHIRHNLKFDDDIIENIKNYMNNFKFGNPFNEYGHSWFAKAGGFFMRLCVAFHFWTSDKPLASPISNLDAELASKLLFILMNHAVYIYHPGGYLALEYADKIMKSIDRIDYDERQKILNEGITSTTICQRTGLSKENVLNGLDILKKSNEIDLLDEGRGNLTVILRESVYKPFCNFDSTGLNASSSMIGY